MDVKGNGEGNCGSDLSSFEEFENLWLFLEEAFLKHSPSRKQLKVEQELKVRESIHEFIIKLGSLLKLDAQTIFAASVYLNKFYMRVPITTSKYFVASAAIAISCKLNDTYRQPTKIALHSCAIKNPHKEITEKSSLFWVWRDQLLYREELMLKTLNFELDLHMPYEIRDRLMAHTLDHSGFNDKKFNILKNTVASIELLSALPVLVAYDINTVFGCILILIIYEAAHLFHEDLKLPPEYIDLVAIDIDVCYKCYLYILKLLDYCNVKDAKTHSNKNAIKRIKRISRHDFFVIAQCLLGSG